MIQIQGLPLINFKPEEPGVINNKLPLTRGQGSYVCYIYDIAVVYIANTCNVAIAISRRWRNLGYSQSAEN